MLGDALREVAASKDPGETARFACEAFVTRLSLRGGLVSVEKPVPATD